MRIGIIVLIVFFICLIAPTINLSHAMPGDLAPGFVPCDTAKNSATIVAELENARTLEQERVIDPVNPETGFTVGTEVPTWKDAEAFFQKDTDPRLKYIRNDLETIIAMSTSPPAAAAI
jgi:hypothetical protein